MRITELKTYNDAAFENSDNIARIHGFVSYAPLTDFRPDSDWFTREDGTIAAMSVRFKEGKTWLRAPHVIYSTSKGTSQNRDIQGISYKTVLSGIYAAHSAALINELHQAALLKLAVFVNTPSGRYIIGNPTHPVRLNFNFNTAEKYRLEWTQFSSLPFRGLETLPIIVDVGGLDPTLVSLLPVAS